LAGGGASAPDIKSTRETTASAAEENLSPSYRSHLNPTTATIAGTKKITKNIGNSSRNAYPARATPKYIFTAATRNHPTTNAIVAVPIARDGCGATFAAATKTPQLRSPAKIIKAVRINLSVAARRAYHTANSQAAATNRLRKNRRQEAGASGGVLAEISHAARERLQRLKKALELAHNFP
jgi:hypothetical protein